MGLEKAKDTTEDEAYDDIDQRMDKLLENIKLIGAMVNPTSAPVEESVETEPQQVDLIADPDPVEYVKPLEPGRGSRLDLSILDTKPNEVPVEEDLQQEVSKAKPKRRDSLKTLPVRLKPEQIQQWKEWAAENDMSLRGFVIEAVEQRAAETPRNQVPEKPKRRWWKR